MDRCSAKNRLGRRCRGYAVAGSPFCFWHEPHHAHQRLQASRRGGRNRRARAGPWLRLDADLKSVDGLLLLLEGLMDETLKLRNSAHRSRALASLALAQKRLLERRAAEQKESHTRPLSFLQNRHRILRQGEDDDLHAKGQTVFRLPWLLTGHIWGRACVDALN